MTRQTLPNRRPSATFPVTWQDHSFSVTVGFDPDSGRLSEVFFAGGQKTGTGLQHTIADACVVLSIAMQHGVPAEVFGKSLGRGPDFSGTDLPASPIGAIVDALTESIVPAE